MRIRIVLSSVFILCCVVTKVAAQDYLITTKGDSVVGKIKIEKIGIEKKLFVTTPEKKKIQYTMFQFRYAFINNVRYEAIKRGEVFDIVQVLKKGYLTLYAFQVENQFTYDGFYLGKADGKSVEVANLTFKKQMLRFLDDCPSVVDGLEKGEFKRSTLNELVDAYNACITKSTEVMYATPNAQATPVILNGKSWDIFKEKLSNSQLENKESLLEMFDEIRNKKAKGEKIPNFLLASFKNGIAADATLPSLLEDLLKE